MEEFYFEMIKIYKLSKFRISLSIGEFFIKILISKKNLNFSNFKFKAANINFNYLKSHFLKPNVFYKKKFVVIDFELQKYIKSLKELEGEEIKFIKNMNLILSEFDKKRIETIDWREILYPDILMKIKNQKKTLFLFIESILDNFKYPLTGMHGDLNCNNILIDEKQSFGLLIGN